MTPLPANYLSRTALFQQSRSTPSVSHCLSSRLTGQGGGVKACLHRPIITPRKHAICRVGGRSFHKQTPPGCQGRTSVTCTSALMRASLLSHGRAGFSAQRREQVESSAFQRRRRLDLLTLFTRSKSGSVTTPEVAHRLNRFRPQIPRPCGFHDKWTFKLHVVELAKLEFEALQAASWRIQLTAQPRTQK